MTASQNGTVVLEEHGKIDAFHELIKKDGAAAVTAGMTQWRSHPDGGVTVKFEVQLHCDQNEESINKAGELAFEKAIEMTSVTLQSLFQPTG